MITPKSRNYEIPERFCTMCNANRGPFRRKEEEKGRKHDERK